MAISHVFAEGVGPFKSVHLDLRGPDGKPSLGPHVLAGVNGSGKSTVLKAISWCLTSKGDEFPEAEWAHYLRVGSASRVLLLIDSPGWYGAQAISSDQADEWKVRLMEWATRCFVAAGLDPNAFPFRGAGLHSASGSLTYHGAVFGGKPGARLNVAAYSSAPSVRYLELPGVSPAPDTSDEKSLGFESTVQNAAIQSWLLGLYSKRAIAKERHQSSSRYTNSFEALERGLKRICGDHVAIEVELEPHFQPRLRIGSQTLNFSQIPDGVRVTLGWLADFLMRADSAAWQEVGGAEGGLLLFDEIEGFLHPLWQRRLLPALREALPKTQSIVTSHSPFVLSSSRDAIVHVLKLSSDGSAYAEPPVPAPVGESITATLKDIFGVESRFDVQTEEQLAEWNELKKIKMQRALSAADESRFQELYGVLASRSEELRSLVTPTPEWSQATVDDLAEAMGTRRTKKGSLVSR